jgi:hypothetical protein
MRVSCTLAGKKTLNSPLRLRRERTEHWVVLDPSESARQANLESASRGVLLRCLIRFSGPRVEARGRRSDVVMENAPMISHPIESERFKKSLFSAADEIPLTVFRTTYLGVLKDKYGS